MAIISPLIFATIAILYHCQPVIGSQLNFRDLVDRNRNDSLDPVIGYSHRAFVLKHLQKKGKKNSYRNSDNFLDNSERREDATFLGTIHLERRSHCDRHDSERAPRTVFSIRDKRIWNSLFDLESEESCTEPEQTCTYGRNMISKRCANHPLFSVGTLRSVLVRGGTTLEDAVRVDDETHTDHDNTKLQDSADDEGKDVDDDDVLSEKVHAAMRRLGLLSPEVSVNEESSFVSLQSSVESAQPGSVVECTDGLCPLPSPTLKKTESNLTSLQNTDKAQYDISSAVKKLSSELEVDESIVMAAIGATMRIREESSDFQNEKQIREEIDLDAAREMIQIEMDAIARVVENSKEVQQLVSEGYDRTLCRRALAFADMNVENARAILQADEEDAEAEAAAAIKAEENKNEEKRRIDAEMIHKAEKEMKAIRVDSNFDPINLSPVTEVAKAPVHRDTQQDVTNKARNKVTRKEDVVFQVNAANLESVVLESPVPVLLDVYADWCGPCKALTPALEDMAIKAGGLFRLAKMNTDDERVVSQALEITSLPTVFGIKDGKVLNQFQGIPRSDDFMKKFMMGLIGVGSFDPPLTSEDQRHFMELTNKIIKLAGAATYTFSQRELLQDRIYSRLDDIVEKGYSGDMAAAEETVRMIRSLLSNIAREPLNEKYRTVNLENKFIAAKISGVAPAISILKFVGFAQDKDNEHSLVLGERGKYVRVAAVVIARDCIDKWLDKNRRNIAAAARKKNDDLARAKLLNDSIIEEDNSVCTTDTSCSETFLNANDSDLTTLKVRVEGKKKTYEVEIAASDQLRSLFGVLSQELDGINLDDVQVTCASKKLTIKASDDLSMSKSFRDHKLHPHATIVIKPSPRMIESDHNNDRTGVRSLKERAEARRAMKRGAHTMQSIGLYATNDNAKGELIDGGGGVWYEHDVSDDGETGKEE